MQENLFKPLGLNNINMFPTEDMKKKLAFMHQRAPDGNLSGRDHLLRRAITASTPEEKAAIFNSGGAGAFAKPSEYCREYIIQSVVSFILTIYRYHFHTAK